MIEFRHVSFAYPGQSEDRLQDLNLTISDGECVLFCGRSGCGKTTVTRLVNGLIPHFFAGELTGDVIVDERYIAKLPMYQIAEKVGSVFQNPRTQFFNVDTDSEIAFGIENEGVPPDELRLKVDGAVKDLKLQKLQGRRIFSLSGGEKQKIAFASVYAMNPDIYLLDEPSSNLDVDAIEDLRKNLIRIKRQGKTILVAEHRLYYLKDLVDRIVYMEQGKVRGIYTPEQFLSIPAVQREKMGLRAMDLHSVKPLPKPAVQALPVLDIRAMALYYKKQPVMSGINLRAARGEIISVTGHNGTGKSTFLRALCGLHKGCTGACLWDGKGMDSKQRLKSSYMVMQDVNYQLFAESVEKECCFGIKNPDADIVTGTMKELGLYEYRNRHPNTLSGGQKQRTAVAVSMICRKEILIFDEPTSGLDFDGMLQVSRLLSRLARGGKIIFVVTHDYEFISAVCSRVVHFDSGTVQEDFAVNQKNLGKLQDFFILGQRRDDIEGAETGQKNYTEIGRKYAYEAKREESNWSSAQMGGKG